MSDPVRVACLLSGAGRSVANLHGAIARDSLPISIVIAASTRPNVEGLRAAAELGIPIREIPAIPADTLDDRLDAALEEAGTELVVLAGYLRLFRMAHWKDRCINIHPSLLPKFGGRGMWGERVHKAVLTAGENESGCTVHWVDDRYDQGSIILQRRCPVERGMDVRQLARRVFEEERLALPEAVARVARWIRCGGPRPALEGAAAPGTRNFGTF
ncbi:MAG: phosphoribosylglycinamide formyltransferase [Planctomycetes bacterium]|nr:phosphoribosylglycinamide formyltransferase [Planctomycetota bacterium]